MTQSPVDCDVLIVGAGPTGLTAAILLRRAGLSVRIVDKRETPSDKSRALAIHARTLELLDSIGLAQRFVDEGLKSDGIDFFIAGRRAGGFAYDRARSPDTPYPFVLLLPQARTEAILADELTQQEVTVERGVTVVALRQEDGRVWVDTMAGSGRSGRISAAYVVGADGARSVVRRLLDMPFDGVEHPARFMLADCAIGWPAATAFSFAQMQIFMNGAAIAIVLPIAGKARSRVIVVDRSRPRTTAPTIGEVEAAFAAAVGRPVALTDAVWLSHYSVHSRLVPDYRVGRVFLAGDAAHIHSPAGGQGMNTGMQDAGNLAWKLAAVIRQDAPAELLDTYGPERRPVAQEVLATSDRMFGAVAEQKGWRAMLRDLAARITFAVVPRLAAAQRRSFRRIAQLEISYPPSLCVEGDDAGFGPDGPRPGHRAPNVAISRGVHMFDLFAGFGHTVLVFAQAPDGSVFPDALRRDAALLKRDGVTVHVVERAADGLKGGSAREAFALYGLHGANTRAIYVVRPDGYIAWRRRGLDFEACRLFLHRVASRGDDKRIITEGNGRNRTVTALG